MSGETVIATGLFSRITPGYRLNEIYEIDSLLATGGMGEVYRGHAIETGDQVAIKTIRPEFAQNTSALALFKKEATALRNLYHEAIVRYFVFSIDRGLPYLAMEFVEGKSLSDALQKGPLGFDDLQVLRKRLASGLFAAHELGIIHRDVSPDNIILPGENLARAKIIDFGIARSSAAGEGTVIGSGFAGKFSYVSPEQLGLFGGDVGPRSDIYSLGLVLAECALGKAIDMGHSHVDVIDKRRKVPDLSGIDARLRPLLTTMLQPDPKDRPASMAAIAEWTPARKRGGGAGKTVAAIAAALVLAAGLGAAGLYVYPMLSGAGSGGSGSVTEIASAPSLPAEQPRLSSPAGDPRSEALLPQAPPPARPQEPLLPSTPAPAPSPAPTASVPSTPSTGAAPGPTATVSPAAPPANVPAAAPPADPAPGQVASLPQPPDPMPAEPPPAGRPASVDQVASYLQNYKGGDCFFVAPTQLATREAKIEAFGSTPTPFIAFDTAFQRTMGFEPEINLRQITQQQCPVTEFLSRMNAQRGARPPRLALRSDRLKSGQELSGTVDVRGEPNVEVLLVADDGLVHNLGAFTKRSGDRLDLNLRVEASGAGEKPQLVVAVTSPRPLPGLKSSSPVPAERFFRQLVEDTRAMQGVNVATRYFKLGT